MEGSERHLRQEFAEGVYDLRYTRSQSQRHSLCKFLSCRRLGVERVITVVPSRKGFAHNPTHRVFIDIGFFGEAGLLESEGFRIIESGYFPFPWKSMGDYFTHNELRIIHDRI